MKYRVFGKITENKYEIVNCKKSVRENGVINEVFTGKPHWNKVTEVVEKPEILSFESDGYDVNYGTMFSFTSFHLSEEEAVKVSKSIFRADLVETHLFTDKIVEERPGNKEEAEATLDKLVKEFNKTMIKSNDKLRAYCDIHHLSYANTDCIELFKLVYPGREWRIIGGKLVEVIYVAATADTARPNLDCLESDIAKAVAHMYTESTIRTRTNLASTCATIR